MVRTWCNDEIGVVRRLKGRGLFKTDRCGREFLWIGEGGGGHLGRRLVVVFWGVGGVVVSRGEWAVQGCFECVNALVAWFWGGSWCPNGSCYKIPMLPLPQKLMNSIFYWNPEDF